MHEATASQPPQRTATGPRTEAGKAVSSQNARKHDLCSRTLRLSADEWAEYNSMCERYRRDLAPAGDVQQALVDEICFNYWRLQQAREVELDVITEHPTILPMISLYIRYRTGYERAFYKGLETIRKIQAESRSLPQPEAILLTEPEASAPTRTQTEASSSPKNEAPPRKTPLSLDPPPPVRSADPVSQSADSLAGELQDHHLENRVRSEFRLPPLPVPSDLARRVKEFISKNPTRSHKQLSELMKKAA